MNACDWCVLLRHGELINGPTRGVATASVTLQFRKHKPEERRFYIHQNGTRVKEGDGKGTPSKHNNKHNNRGRDSQTSRW